MTAFKHSIGFNMDFHHSEFFDLSGCSFADFILSKQYPWELFSEIVHFIQKNHFGYNEAKISPHAYLVNPETISIGAGTIVEAGAYIQGPCIIGRHCQIRHGAYIRGNLITGDHCVIGHASEIKTAIFLNHVHAAHFAYVGDSFCGNHVNLGAGAKLANLRLDRKEITTFLYQTSIKTYLRKFGAILGDSTQIGCNSVTNPGFICGKQTLCYPCTNIGGFFPAHSTIKNQQDLIISSPLVKS